MPERPTGYEYEDLLTCGRGDLFGPGNAQLPLPPMLMFERISAISDTGAKGAGFGLSSGGGQGTGAQLDVGNFCCPEYLVTMQQLIRRNWNEKQTSGGEVIVKFTIQRTGMISDIVLERSSGFAALDLESQRALSLTRQLPPLPAQFPDSTLTVHLSFQYQR